MTDKYPKLGRLTKRPEFLFVRGGQYAARPTIIVQMRKRPNPSPADNSDDNSGDWQDIRFGVTATKKVGGAVIRNRAKRRMRQLARALIPKLGLAGHDYVLIARDSTAAAPFDGLQRDTEKALEKLAQPRHNPRKSE